MGNLKVCPDVHTIYESNFRNIPEMLRQSAKCIEENEAAGIKTSAFVGVQLTSDGDIQVYGWGDTTAMHALGVLTAGTNKIYDIIINDGD